MLLTAVLGFINKQNLSDAKTRLSGAETELKQAQSKSQELAKNLSTANQNLATVTAEADQIKAQVSSAQSDVASVKAQVTELTNQKTTLESQLSEAQAALQTMTQERDKAVADLAAKPAETGADEKAQLEEQKALVVQLTKELDSNKSRLSTLNEQIERMRSKNLQNGIEGQVLAVNPAWNFVVLSLGDKNGVVSNAELLVKRGRQLVGKVRVTTVEPSTSIADIVANSVPAGTTIAPGDQVIYQAVTE